MSVARGQLPRAFACTPRASQALQAELVPWGDVARGRRLSDQASMLLGRHSSEDLLYAIFFVLHQYVRADEWSSRSQGKVRVVVQHRYSTTQELRNHVRR